MTPFEEVGSYKEVVEENDNLIENVYSLKQQLTVALEGLNILASWDEGIIVTGSFDSPQAAKISRATLLRVTEIKNKWKIQ